MVEKDNQQQQIKIQQHLHFHETALQYETLKGLYEHFTKQYQIDDLTLCLQKVQYNCILNQTTEVFIENANL